MNSLICAIDDSLKAFFGQLTSALGFGGYLGIILGVEALFIILFVIKSAFSYEARLKRKLDDANKWLFKYKKVNENNIKDFNNIIKKGPKRLVYFWQQYILYRDGEPSKYLSEENLIEKPMKTSSWQSNIKTLSMLTAVWAVVALLCGFASQSSKPVLFQAFAVAVLFSAMVLVLGAIAIIFLKGKRVLNLDDIYHLYHIFARFINNGCADLVPYLDFELLFSAKEISRGNPQLREYYESRARKAKEEFEKANKNEVALVDYDFEGVGVDGALLLERAMKESEMYINQKTTIMSQIAQIEAQKDALKRNSENAQMDLQRKIQASKENMQRLIEQQAATTSRSAVSMISQQQEKEKNKHESLQRDYENEKNRYNSAKAELDAEIAQLNEVLDKGFEQARRGMVSEYHTFYEKLMKNAYSIAEQKVKEEKSEIIKERDKNEDELINVQTQIKRLMDENATLRQKLAENDPNFKVNIGQTPQGEYDNTGNFIYKDGSYHDATSGLYHDKDGNVFDPNGELVEKKIDESEENKAIIDKLLEEQVNQFGSSVDFKEPNDGAKTDDLNQPPSAQSDEALDQAKDGADKTENLKAEEKKSEPQKQEGESASSPVKKRGRPRKTTAQEKVASAPKKRGRPKKSENEKTQASKPQARPGRPRKNTTSTTTAVPSKRPGRPKKNVSSQPQEASLNAPKKRGRPRKVQKVDETLNEINKMIDQEEAKLANAQNDINNKLDQAMKDQNNSQDKDKIMQEVESLTAQADSARQSGQSEDQLAKINTQIEELINQLTILNSDDNKNN